MYAYLCVPTFTEGVLVDRSGITRVAWNLVKASLVVLSMPRTERKRRQWSVIKLHDAEEPPPLALPTVEVVVVEVVLWGLDGSEPLSLRVALVPLTAGPAPVASTPSSSSSSSSSPSSS